MALIDVILGEGAVLVGRGDIYIRLVKWALFGMEGRCNLLGNEIVVHFLNGAQLVRFVHITALSVRDKHLGFLPVFDQLFSELL